MYLFPCFWIESVFDSIPKPIPYYCLSFMKYYVLLYLIGFSNSICVITCTYVMYHSNSVYVLS